MIFEISRYRKKQRALQVALKICSDFERSHFELTRFADPKQQTQPKSIKNQCPKPSKSVFTFLLFFESPQIVFL